ncbi:MAG: DoxX family membrane protein [Actinomycetota bacterium]|nr:DoxX family membrane protein [Actinomycetota bacterium]
MSNNPSGVQGESHDGPQPGVAHEREPAETDPFAALGDTEARTRTHHVVDRFDGSLGLLLLRLVVAAVVGVRGLQKISHRDETVQMLRAVRMPAYDVLGALFGPVQLAMAVALVLGLAVRVVGAGVAASAITALVLVNWATGSQIFTSGVPGFDGDFQLLLAGAGVALLGLGGGGLGLDRVVRNRGTAAS